MPVFHHSALHQNIFRIDVMHQLPCTVGIGVCHDKNPRQVPTSQAKATAIDTATHAVACLVDQSEIQLLNCCGMRQLQNSSVFKSAARVFFSMQAQQAQLM